MSAGWGEGLHRGLQAVAAVQAQMQVPGAGGQQRSRLLLLPDIQRRVDREGKVYVVVVCRLLRETRAG